MREVSEALADELALARLAHQLKPLNFPHAIPVNCWTTSHLLALARQLTLLALAWLARQLI